MYMYMCVCVCVCNRPLRWHTFLHTCIHAFVAYIFIYARDGLYYIRHANVRLCDGYLYTSVPKGP